MSEALGGQLSQSASQALQWAGVLARFRAEFAGDDPNSAQTDSFDLFLGMMLAQPDLSEPGVLLSHFHLTPGQVLPDDYPRPAADDLRRHLAAVADENAVSPDQDAAPILEAANRLGIADIDGEVVEVRSLFAAVFMTGSRVARSLEGLLSGRGAKFSEVGNATEEYVVKEGGDYRSMLEERFPYNPRPVDIPNYKADHGRSASLADDLLDIRAEVDAFAYLLASTRLKPPMAVGLFGDWGSGKSFFMEAVEQRIRSLSTDPQITGDPQSRVPFWKRIIQIRFNAWHYVEGELWASLVNHIFHELRLPEDTDTAVEERRRHWIEKLDSARIELAELEQKKAARERELQQHRAKAAAVREKRDLAQDKLEQARLESTADIVIEDSRTAINQALQPLMISVLGTSSDEVIGKLQEARQELRRGRVLVDYYKESPRRTLMLMAGVLSIPLVAWAISLFTANGLASLLGSVVAAVGSGTALLGKATAWTGTQLDRIEKAEARVRKEIAAKRAAWQETVDKAQAAVDTIEENLDTIQDEEITLTEKIAEIQKQLDRATPAAILNEFVSERADSDDYSKRLGVPALIQHDFKELSRLVADHNRDVLDPAADVDEDASHSFNRLILYIDDLDRCPDEHVVKVLQAVHLLLAFDLFVVVVAVDSRWLDQALQRHFPALSSENGDAARASSDDYLEKIFQIPFWIQPLSEGARRNMIGGLLGGHLARPGGDTDDELWDHSGLEVGDAEQAILADMAPGAELPLLRAADLTLTSDELEFLDNLAPLLGDTPRAVKRFANLYQLVRIIHRSRGSNGGAEVPNDNELIAFALAIGDGLPLFAPAFMDKLAAATEFETMGTVLGQMHDPRYEAGRERLLTWLVKNNWMNVPVGRSAKFAKLVERFLFRVGRQRLAEVRTDGSV